MKYFSERNPLVVGAVGVVVVAAAVVTALTYSKLPFFKSAKEYSAYFAEAGGLLIGTAVQVSGYKAGKVDSIALDGPRVLVTFEVDKHIRLGERTEASIKTKSLLGAKILEVTPRGDGRLRGPIPLERTTSPYQLPDALGDLAATISGLDTNRLSESLGVLADTFSDTAPDLKIALSGVARFSAVLADRDAQLRNLLSNANKATTVLAGRSDQIVRLVADSNAVLTQLRSQSRALDQISGNIEAASRQVKGFIAEHRQTLKPTLDRLNAALAIVDHRKERIALAIKKFDDYALSLGESMSTGPWFNFYIANLIPGQFIQPFIDAAFSDLGLDPNVLLPSQLTDPEVGQPGTPALPMPYPRTGQGGEPQLTLPDAITGNPGDPRYPYREPPPAPPPGGPPPGPPALAPGQTSPPPVPTHPPVFVPAPGEQR
ncbi:mammalian cell entry protein [Mycobacterium gordonae]|uniref:Mammalian cell entry protein n=1 Tax=Mycobacterium gordonae TaxID=1778 RepID=A0A0Q2LV66_MYCGO|nr:MULTISPECIES: MCE family protein [Mycobacterium]KQH79690.1 mammalian cell entry protein [Mycobacterium gordonae]MDP7729383.1 MCE family protein [Mycobacterium sp. TY813]